MLTHEDTLKCVSTTTNKCSLCVSTRSLGDRGRPTAVAPRHGGPLHGNASSQSQTHSDATTSQLALINAMPELQYK